MRIMTMHKNDARSEAGEMPSKELIENMGAFIGGYAKSGRLLDGAGLLGSKHRTRLTFRGGEASVKHGPYAGEKELPASFLLLKVSNRDEAIGWATRYGKILGDGEIELGKVTEPWDLGVMPMPENPPLQMLLIEKEGAGQSTKQKSDLTRLKTEMTKAGVLVREHHLKPSAVAKRLLFTNNKMKVLDGPFAESKELVGGFAVMELSGMEEAVELAIKYAEILGGTLEVDLRPLEDAAT